MENTLQSSTMLSRKIAVAFPEIHLGTGTKPVISK